MSVIHSSEAEAARDFASLMAQVHAGAEIAIKDGLASASVFRVVVCRDALEHARRTPTESLRLASAHTVERGYDVVIDADFAANVEARIRARKSRDTSAWK